MNTAEAKALYKQRSRTVELNFADMKEHRGMRRFHCRGPRRVGAETGAVILAHNLLTVDAYCQPESNNDPAQKETLQTPCVA
jgi:hypothetical protein